MEKTKIVIIRKFDDNNEKNKFWYHVNLSGGKKLGNAYLVPKHFNRLPKDNIVIDEEGVVETGKSSIDEIVLEILNLTTKFFVKNKDAIIEYGDVAGGKELFLKIAKLQKEIEA